MSQRGIRHDALHRAGLTRNIRESSSRPRQNAASGSGLHPLAADFLHSLKDRRAPAKDPIQLLLVFLSRRAIQYIYTYCMSAPQLSWMGTRAFGATIKEQPGMPQDP